MLFVDNRNEHDPALNLALEEYVLMNAATAEDLLLFYINSPSIIIGRHQNTIEEINREYVEQHGIHVVRRLSGGGAVYHELGTLNFSFITEARPENFRNFAKFTEPVIQALHALGVNAELSGRNDILVDGRKISGNAQYISKGRMASHGTLLLNSDLSHVGDALRVKESKIASKSIKSVRSRVANISEFLANPISIEDFRDHILRQVFSDQESIPQYLVTEADWMAVTKLADERYRTWEWNYGRSPAFNVEKCERFPGGEIDARLDVHKGTIRSIKFYGDYFAELEADGLEQKLLGIHYNREEIIRVIQEVQIDRYFSGMDCETFVNFLY